MRKSMSIIEPLFWKILYHIWHQIITFVFCVLTKIFYMNYINYPIYYIKLHKLSYYIFTVSLYVLDHFIDKKMEAQINLVQITQPAKQNPWRCSEGQTGYYSTSELYCLQSRNYKLRII